MSHKNAWKYAFDVKIHWNSGHFPLALSCSSPGSVFYFWLFLNVDNEFRLTTVMTNFFFTPLTHLLYWLYGDFDDDDDGTWLQKIIERADKCTALKFWALLCFCSSSTSSSSSTSAANLKQLSKTDFSSFNKHSHWCGTGEEIYII